MVHTPSVWADVWPLSGVIQRSRHWKSNILSGRILAAAGAKLGNEKARPAGLALKLVGLPGVEPGTNGLCVPLQFSLPLSSSWSGLSLTFRLARTVSTPSSLK